MSHLKEREEKNCLNCNAQLEGTYCHICGQENIHPKESVWHLINHLFQDVTHFDGKFFSTGKLLITRPGLLTREYAKGRRASYLNPIRMYIFTSAFFFLIFFSYIQPKDTIVEDNKVTTDSLLRRLDKQKQIKIEKLKTEKDTAEINEIKSAVQHIGVNIDSLLKDSTAADRLDIAGKNSTVLEFLGKKYRNRKYYDSIQQTLPPAQRDNFITRTFTYKGLELNEKYKNKGKEALEAIIEKFLHHLPQLLFVSLPFFALLLRLLYIRRKEFYYVNHLIFTFHYYIFAFISFLIIFSLTKINEVFNWGLIGFCKGMMWLFIFFYLYKAMRNFYGQRRARTVFKFIILNFLFMFVLIFLFSVFFFYSLFQI